MSITPLDGAMVDCPRRGLTPVRSKPPSSAFLAYTGTSPKPFQGVPQGGVAAGRDALAIKRHRAQATPSCVSQLPLPATILA